MADTVPVSLQCSAGRLELQVDTRLTIRETLRQFKRAFSELDNINMADYVINHRGKLYLDDSITLQTAEVGVDSVLVLLKKTSCPAANPGVEEEL
ncbi:hypothetical protein ERJ75_000723600 [Trypanosoma vivax]|nr:hypothetical protein ERJ75_000723600 [Trypanosoma vivax]